MATPVPNQKLPQRVRGLGLDIVCRVNLHPLNRKEKKKKRIKVNIYAKNIRKSYLK